MSRQIEILYNTYAPMVLRRCMAILGDEDLAHDAMHDVFAKAFESYAVRTIRYPSSLLYRMATNHSLNLIRRRRREEYRDDIVERIVSYDESFDRTDARDVLRHIFASHTPSTRVMAYMYYVDGMKLQQIADEFGMSVPGVKKRLSKFRRAVSDLREELF